MSNSNPKQVNEEKIIVQPSKTIVEKGNEIIESHDFYKDLSELMEDKKFSSFF